MQKCKTCEGEKDERKDDDDGKKGAWVYIVGGASNIVYCPSTATHITSVLPKAILHTHTFQEEHDGTHRTKEIWKNNKDSHSRVKKLRPLLQLGRKQKCVAEMERDCVTVSK